MKEASYGQILFHIKGIIDELIVELDVNGLYAYARTQLRIPKGKPKKWINGIVSDILTCTFIIKVEVLDVIEKSWSKFKKGNVYIIDNITYKDLIEYQNAKIKIRSGVYWDEGYIDNSNDVLNNLLYIKSHSNDVDEIYKIKNQITFIHGLLLTKDKIKKVIKTKDELESFIEMNEPILLGYYKKRGDGVDNMYNLYLKRTYDLKFTNVLYGIQIRSMAKHVMIKYFDYCHKNNVKIFYCNTDSILIKENDIKFMKQFIFDNIGDLNIEGKDNNGVIISQGKYSLFGDDKNKIRPN
jgi:hypothetical protein